MNSEDYENFVLGNDARGLWQAYKAEEQRWLDYMMKLAKDRREYQNAASFFFLIALVEGFILWIR